MLNAIFRHIETNREAFLARLIEYLRQPSIATANLGIAEAAELACGVMTAAGLDARIVDFGDHPFVLGKWLQRPGAPTVLLYGHYDVQPPGAPEEWVTPAFDPTVRDGRIYARGVGDNKGQHFAQLLAIESHLRVTGTLPCNVIVLLEGEEEVGSPHIARFIEAHRNELSADLAIVSDGPLHESGRPVIKYGVRGLLKFELIATGAKRDVHSGNFGGVVPNPIWTLVHLLASMKDRHGNITIDGICDQVKPPTSMEREAMRNLPMDVAALKAELGLANLDQPLDRPYFERLMFHPTLTINGVAGGHAQKGVKTIIPHRAIAKLDMRLVNAQTPEEVARKIAAHVERFGPGVEFRVDHGTLSSKTAMESPFAAAIRKAVADAQGVAPLEYPSGGGTLPLYVFTKTLGLDTFLVPYANHDEANHAPNENMKVSCFYNGIRTGAAMLSHLGAVERHGVVSV